MGFAFIFETVGGTEWLVLLGVVLIVVGPKNLPSAARKLGQLMSNLRRAADEFKRQLLSMDEEVRKTVEDAVAADASAETPDRLGSEEPATSGYEGQYDENGDPYPEGSPYPGHEAYFDDAAGDAPVAESAEEAPAAPAAPTEDELRAVKITVSPAPGKRK